MVRRVAASLSLTIGIAVAATAVYLGALLFGYVFDISAVRRHHVESAAYIFVVVAFAAAWSRGKQNTPERIRVNRDGSRWLITGFVVAAVLLYGNTIFLGMFSDDFALAQSALAGQWFPQAGFVRPLPLGVWSLFRATPSSAAVLHIFNICLHGLNAALVCLLAMRIGLPFAGAMAAGVLFVAFPSSVEAVVWPAAVHDLLVSACAIGFLLLAGRPATIGRVIAATIVLALALLSKESAVAIPLLAIVLWVDVTRPHRTPGWPILVAGIALLMVYVAVRMALVTIPDSYAQEPTRYVVKELITRPIATLSLPWATAVFRSWPVIPFLWAITCVVGAATYPWRANGAIPVQTILRCLIAIVVTVLPMYSFLFVTPDLENGRYMYLATAFWVIALVGLVSTPDGLTRTPAIVIGVAVIVGTIGVQWHLMPWKEAALVRERVIVAAEDILRSAPCTSVSLAGAPDSVRGAYIFRNGLAQAIAFRTSATPVGTLGSCAFVWDGSAFLRTDRLSVPLQATFTR